MLLVMKQLISNSAFARILGTSPRHDRKGRVARNELERNMLLVMIPNVQKGVFVRSRNVTHSSTFLECTKAVRVSI
jgi:hypothetical protein